MALIGWQNFIVSNFIGLIYPWCRHSSDDNKFIPFFCPESDLQIMVIQYYHITICSHLREILPTIILLQGSKLAFRQNANYHLNNGENSTLKLILKLFVSANLHSCPKLPQCFQSLLGRNCCVCFTVCI